MSNVIPRRVFAVLTTLLVVFGIAAAIFLAFHVLLTAIGDSAAAGVLRWIGLGCLALLAVDVVLLAGALGIRAMQSRENGDAER